MAKESSDLLHLLSLVTSGPKPKWLVLRSSKNKRLKVPETNGMSHRRVPLGKPFLKLIDLEVISDCLITAKLWPLITLPTFGTHLLATHRLHLSHRVRVRLHRHCQHHQCQNYQNALRFHFHFFGGVLDKEASLSFWVFLGCVCFFLVMLWLWCEGRSKRKRRELDRRSFSFEKGWGQRVVKWGASLRNGRWIGREGVRGLSGNRLDLWGWNIGSYTAEISHRHLTNEANSILHSLWSFFYSVLSLWAG